VADVAASKPAWRITFDGPARLKALVVGVVFIWLFWDQLAMLPGLPLGRLVYTWLHKSDWSHGPIIPLFSAYLVYSRWDEIRRCPIRYTGVGLALLLAGLALYVYALFGLNFGYVIPLAMLICLLGVIIYLCGLPAMWYLWVPWMYLFFAIPVPQSKYFYLTNPLQRWAAMFATTVLSLHPQLTMQRDAYDIVAIYQGVASRLSVDDACSGMRSTMTLCALGVAIAFLSDRPWWQRLLLVASCVPIAVFCNFIRVLITCYLHIFVGAEYAEGNYHTLLGLLMLAVAFAVFSGLAWILRNLVVTVPDEPAAPAAR
jgi:exosortase